MDVQRVERIADFMRDAGREQRQGLDALAFDGLEGFLPRLGRIVQNQRHAGTAGGLRQSSAARRRAGEIAGADSAPQIHAARRACRPRGRRLEMVSQSSSGKMSATCKSSASGGRPMSRVTAWLK